MSSRHPHSAAGNATSSVGALALYPPQSLSVSSRVYDPGYTPPAHPHDYDAEEIELAPMDNVTSGWGTASEAVIMPTAPSVGIGAAFISDSDGFSSASLGYPQDSAQHTANDQQLPSQHGSDASIPATAADSAARAEDDEDDPDSEAGKRKHRRLVLIAWVSLVLAVLTWSIMGPSFVYLNRKGVQPILAAAWRHQAVVMFVLIPMLIEYRRFPKDRRWRWFARFEELDEEIKGKEAARMNRRLSQMRLDANTTQASASTNDADATAQTQSTAITPVEEANYGYSTSSVMVTSPSSSSSHSSASPTSSSSSSTSSVPVARASASTGVARAHVVDTIAAPSANDDVDDEYANDDKVYLGSGHTRQSDDVDEEVDGSHDSNTSNSSSSSSSSDHKKSKGKFVRFADDVEEFSGDTIDDLETGSDRRTFSSSSSPRRVHRVRHHQHCAALRNCWRRFLAYVVYYLDRPIMMTLLNAVLWTLSLSLWVSSLRFTTTVSASLLSSLSPIILVGMLKVRGKTVSRGEAVGVVVSFVGVALCVLSTIIAGERDAKGNEMAETGIEYEILGDLMNIGCSFALAASTIIGAKARREVPLFVHTFVCTASVGILQLFLTLALEGSTLQGLSNRSLWGWATDENILQMMFLGFMGGLIGLVGFNLSVKYLSALVYTVVQLLDPFLTGFIAYGMGFEDPPAWPVFVGGVVVSAGIIILVKAEDARVQKEAAEKKAKEDSALNDALMEEVDRDTGVTAARGNATLSDNR